MADRSLLDTLAARDRPVTALAGVLGEVGRWAVGHVLDFDDLHTSSTTDVSAVRGSPAGHRRPARGAATAVAGACLDCGGS
jgi:hypothetical protein